MFYSMLKFMVWFCQYHNGNIFSKHKFTLKKSPYYLMWKNFQILQYKFHGSGW
jgi:hypothetical protein